jgi:7-carboxy-7-deazaguanine synthase
MEPSVAPARSRFAGDLHPAEDRARSSPPEGAPSRSDDPPAAAGAASQLLPQADGVASSNVSQLRITEIFFSLQGETSRVGLPTVFIRLTGCPLRCTYCDTTYAFTGGRNMTVCEVLDKVAEYSPNYVTVTGGEPLSQKNCLPLLRALCDAGYKVSLETGGALDISQVDARVMRVVDIKTPASGEAEKNRWENLVQLTLHDEIKFVLCDESDYQWAKQVMFKYHLADKCPVLMSPVHGVLNATQLAEWILHDRLPVRLQLQLHKLLWDNLPGH